MKISKSILSAMTAGILAVGMTSCETDIVDVSEHTEECTVECTLDHNKENTENGHTPWNCPGCGMG